MRKYLLYYQYPLILGQKQFDNALLFGSQPSQKRVGFSYMTCHDDLQFTDHRGGGCPSWKGFSIMDLKYFRFSKDEQLALYENCPETLGLCSKKRSSPLFQQLDRGGLCFDGPPICSGVTNETFYVCYDDIMQERCPRRCTLPECSLGSISLEKSQHSHRWHLLAQKKKQTPGAVIDPETREIIGPPMTVQAIATKPKEKLPSNHFGGLGRIVHGGPTTFGGKGKIGQGCRRFSEGFKDMKICLANGSICGKRVHNVQATEFDTPSCGCENLKLMAYCSYRNCGSVNHTWNGFCEKYKKEHPDCNVECSRATSFGMMSLLFLLL